MCLFAAFCRFLLQLRLFTQVVEQNRSLLCPCKGRTAIHRAVEAHGQPTDTSGTDLQEVKDSTDIISLLVMHGADINQPV